VLADEQEARLKSYRRSQGDEYVSKLAKQAVNEERAKLLAKNVVPQSGGSGSQPAKLDDGWTEVWN
jgi:hypothetical protein